jgi:hypothetical protein
LGHLCIFGGGLGAEIDGQNFPIGFFSIGIGGDGGSSITGYDAQLQPVIVQDLTAYVQVTSNVCMGTPGFQDCLETFNILSAPEPTTWLLCGLGLAGLYWRRMANPIVKQGSQDGRSSY